jgi:hypothetical protein
MNISLSLSKMLDIMAFIGGWTLIALFAMLAVSLVVSVAKGLISLTKNGDSTIDSFISDYAEPERLKPVK